MTSPATSPVIGSVAVVPSPADPTKDVGDPGTLPPADPDFPGFAVDAQLAANLRMIDDVEIELKRHLRGCRVFDKESGDTRLNGGRGREVAVYYRGETIEAGVPVGRDGNPLAGGPDRHYPNIVLTLTGVQKATYREHRGYVGPSATTYAIGNHAPGPSGYLEEVHLSDWPIPYDLVYMITTYARQARHDRHLLVRLLMNDMLPDRSGYLVVRDTVRQMERVSGPTPTTIITPGGRLFTQNWVVKITAELYAEGLTITPPDVQRVLLTTHTSSA